MNRSRKSKNPKRKSAEHEYLFHFVKFSGGFALILGAALVLILAAGGGA